MPADKSSRLVFPLFYNGPLNYFARLLREERIILEQYDSYTKQTYRNRCRILGPNEVITLSIPVKKTRGVKNLFRDIRIDYEKPWNKIHWKSLVAAYASSPFFEFIMDDVALFYERKFEFLVDLNRQLLDTTLHILGLDIPTRLTDSFDEITEGDPREMFPSKTDIRTTDSNYQPVQYHQVFSEKHGFRSNLSILDLMFNMGPDSVGILLSSLKV